MARIYIYVYDARVVFILSLGPSVAGDVMYIVGVRALRGFLRTLTWPICKVSGGNIKLPKEGGRGLYGWAVADISGLAHYLPFIYADKIRRVKIVPDILQHPRLRDVNGNWQIPI